MTTVAVYRQVRRCWDLDAGELVERREVASFFPMPDEKYQQEGKRYTYDGIPRWPFRGPGGRQVFRDDMHNYCHSRGRIVETPTVYGVERKGGETPIMVEIPAGAEVYTASATHRVVLWPDSTLTVGKRIATVLHADDVLRAVTEGVVSRDGRGFRILEAGDGRDERGEGGQGLGGSNGGAVALDRAVSAGGYGDGHHRDFASLSDAEGGESVSEGVRGQISTVAAAGLVLAGDVDPAGREELDVRKIAKRGGGAGACADESPNGRQRHPGDEDRLGGRASSRAGDVVLSPDGSLRLTVPAGHRAETDGRKIVVVGGDKHVTTSWAMIAASVRDRPDWRLERVETQEESVADDRVDRGRILSRNADEPGRPCGMDDLRSPDRHPDGLRREAVAVAPDSAAVADVRGGRDAEGGEGASSAGADLPGEESGGRSDDRRDVDLRGGAGTRFAPTPPDFRVKVELQQLTMF
jgi:hypothetical protein